MPRQASRPDVLRSATVRDFSGGWNVIDNDLNLTSKFAKELTNISRGLDGSNQVRWGTRLFADLTADMAVGSRPVGQQYFGTRIITVFSNGDIFATDSDAATTKIWPDGGDNWNTCTQASFAQFKGDLIVVNGIDKPVKISSAYVCEFLVDLGTMSNVNVPICKYVRSGSRYLIMAGDPLNPDRVHISNKDTSGTWYGDAAPNDGTFVDLGSRISEDDYTIRSIGVFRDKIIVGFTNSVIPGTLGIYDSTDHIPEFTDPIMGHGSIAHHSMASIGDDMFFADAVGVPMLSRTLFTSSLRPARASQLVDPAIQEYLNALSFNTLSDRVFAVYNQREGQYMLFIPNDEAAADTTETPCFVFTSIPTLQIKAWALFKGWNFACGCRSSLGRIFFASYDGKIYIYGSNDDKIYADFVDDTDAAADGDGVAIDFVWEMPWSDLGERIKVKNTRYLGFDTRGNATFTIEFYVDNILSDADGNRDPLLTMAMVGGDGPGYGGGSQSYGGGRRAGDERLWAWPAKFKIMKFRISGSTKAPLNFVAITLAYRTGSIRR
jgi:hypothetical protein